MEFWKRNFFLFRERSECLFGQFSLSRETIGGSCLEGGCWFNSLGDSSSLEHASSSGSTLGWRRSLFPEVEMELGAPISVTSDDSGRSFLGKRNGGRGD